MAICPVDFVFFFYLLIPVIALASMVPTLKLAIIGTAPVEACYVGPVLIVNWREKSSKLISRVF